MIENLILTEKTIIFCFPQVFWTFGHNRDSKPIVFIEGKQMALKAIFVLTICIRHLWSKKQKTTDLEPL